MTSQSTQEQALSNLAKCPRGPDQWSDLYLAFWPYVYTICYRALGALGSLAEDAAQEVFLGLLRVETPLALDDPERFRLQLWSRCRDVCRSIRRRERRFDSKEESSTIGRMASPDIKVESADLFERITKSLRKTDSVLLNLMLTDKSIPDIAKELSITQNAVTVRIHRLRRRMRIILYHMGL